MSPSPFVTSPRGFMVPPLFLRSFIVMVLAVILWVIHSVSGLFDDMVTRLYHDASIMYIGVSLKSGRFVCEAYLD